MVAPSGSGDAAGVEVVNNATQTPVTTGVATVTATCRLDVAFANLPAALDISEMNVTLTDLRLPTSCPTPAANVTISADSQTDSTSKTASAPLNVTGCSGLPYARAADRGGHRDQVGRCGANARDHPGGERVGKHNIVLHLGGSITPNVGADIPCLTGTGCTIGTATATSPLLPSVVLASGTVRCGGSATSPTITSRGGSVRADDQRHVESDAPTRSRLRTCRTCR